MRIDAIIQSTGYHDMLSITLPINKIHFNNVIVYTKIGDEQTKAVCRKENVICVETDKFTKNNSKFNRGAVYNQSFIDLFHNYAAIQGQPDWICIIDSDIILPSNFRESFQNENPDIEYFYGARRYNVETQEQWNEVKKDINYLKKLTLYRGYGYGYLQIFNVKSKVFSELCKNTNWNPYLEWHDGSMADWVFRNAWGDHPWNPQPLPPDNILDHTAPEPCDPPTGFLKKLSFNVIHIGITGINSTGRNTPIWDTK
jgi:hypothetical protein